MIVLLSYCDHRARNATGQEHHVSGSLDLHEGFFIAEPVACLQYIQSQSARWEHLETDDTQKTISKHGHLKNNSPQNNRLLSSTEAKISQIHLNSYLCFNNQSIIVRSQIIVQILTLSLKSCKGTLKPNRTNKITFKYYLQCSVKLAFSLNVRDKNVAGKFT